MSFNNSNNFHPETQLICLNENNKDQFGSSVAPLYQTTTFKQTALTNNTSEYDYTRSGNPTRTLLQQQIAKLYGNIDARNVFAVGSGMTALDVILRGLVIKPFVNKTRSHISTSYQKPVILAGDDIYGGTQRLLNFITPFCDVVHVDSTNLQEYKKTFLENKEKVTCCILESPTNPLLKVANLPEIIKFIKQEKPECLTVVDNTMMSGLNCNPLEFQCDVVYESATKYLNGQHDIMAGVIVCSSLELAQQVYFVINSTGSGLSPFDSWLLIRGLKTLQIRLYRQQYNAMILAKWLLSNCGFTKTRYVGLKNQHPQYHLHKSFNKGPGAVLSFETGSIEKSEQIVISKLLKIWGCTVSFGCVNSLISMPCKMSHASIDEKTRQEREFPEDLIRLSVGIENIEDLCKDLLNAFVDAGVIEIVNNGKQLYNKLTGKIGNNVNINQFGKLPNIYEIFDTKENKLGEEEINGSFGLPDYVPTLAKL